MKQTISLVVVGAIGIAAGVLLADVAEPVRNLLSGPPSSNSEGHGGHGDPHGHGAADHAHGGSDHAHGHGDHEHGEEGVVALTAEQIAEAGITLAAVGGGALSQGAAVPGTITANADRLSYIPAGVPGILRTLDKQLGDSVARGDLLARIESREIAELKGEYLAAARSQQLARTVLAREEGLWAKRISAEQDVLQARAAAEEGRIRLDLARQKLAALGLSDARIDALAGKGAGQLRMHEVRAPLAGRIIERKVPIGTSVQPETDLFVIADLSTVWVEMAVSPLDLPAFREGQEVRIRGGDAEAVARLIFVSPVVDRETRTARAVALLDNRDQRWRPGDYVGARVATGSRDAEIVIPRTALQTIEGEQVVFVRSDEGFKKREVVLGRGDDARVEIVFGLDPGERIAVTNSFVLKAELGKAEAEHSH